MAHDATTETKPAGAGWNKIRKGEYSDGRFTATWNEWAERWILRDGEKVVGQYRRFIDAQNRAAFRRDAEIQTVAA